MTLYRFFIQLRPNFFLILIPRIQSRNFLLRFFSRNWIFKNDFGDIVSIIVFARYPFIWKIIIHDINHLIHRTLFHFLLRNFSCSSSCRPLPLGYFRGFMLIIELSFMHLFRPALWKWGRPLPLTCLRLFMIILELLLPFIQIFPPALRKRFIFEALRNWSAVHF